ncbi:DnaB-like helicase C-terminal domain-containing protein [Paenibacillus kribbensis]|uniref:replicative DNA helicase n=1 Tax=Paenibacillus kribbensis TaxID=172713 RepID=UPI002DBA0E22|nr:DnaB-like helicase C-terminal domain-containing protein [Paenibacillus kribbensis]MEC0237803.1 DnaB-like helicase C-terminal domain-containing protein [Paenibacillus kribbensis]
MSLEAERAVLGSIMVKPNLVEECYLNPDEFLEDDRHGLILTTLKYAYEQFGDKPDPFDMVLMVKHWGKNINKIGGVTYLAQLRGSVPTTEHFGFYQNIVRAAYVQSQAAKTFEEAAASGTIDLLEVQTRMDELNQLQKGQAENNMLRMTEVLEGHHLEIMDRGSRAGITGAKTASDDLNEMGSGHQAGDVTIVAARPSIGKTAYLVNDSIAAAEGGTTAAIFSAEMPSKDVSERHLCALGGIDSKKIRTGRLTENDWDSYSKALEILESLPIYIDDTPGMTIEYIWRQAKALKKQHPRLIIYVDYLQLIESERKFSSTSERVSYVSSQFKKLARVLGIPVVVISSVGRKCEEKQDKRPMMSDLRDSGNIEFDADVIIFLYRDDYYYPDTVLKGVMELIVAKGRKIGTGTIQMFFNRKNGRFTDLTKDDKYDLEKKVREHGENRR